MKVLLITDNHSPYGGGAEKHFFTLKELLKNHPDIEVFSLGFGPQKMEGEDFIVLEETPSKALRQLWRMMTNPAKYLQLRKAIKKISPDIIHLHNIKKYTPALLKAVRGYATVQSVHDFSPICPTQWNLHQNLQPCHSGFSFKCLWQHRRDYSFLSYLALLYSFHSMRRLLKKSVKQFIAPSPVLVNYLQKNQYKNAHYLPPFQSNPIANSDFPAKAGHFLFIGQLENQKGVHVLLEEFKRALQKNSGIQLTIAGKGSQENYLKEKVRAWQLQDNIHFVGWNNNPAALYQQCSAVIFPSIGLEAFGLVITEAMAAARPVIGSNRGPTTWLVEDHKSGLLFDPLREGDLAEKILTLANDETLTAALGKNAHEKLKEFPDNSVIIDQIITIYKHQIKED
jgi:glycosyltransferase involved in cell wall biosynthesis